MRVCRFCVLFCSEKKGRPRERSSFCRSLLLFCGASCFFVKRNADVKGRVCCLIYRPNTGLVRG